MHWYIICVFSGIIIGIILRSLVTAGTIKIDTSNPEKDKYLFEIDNLDRLRHRNRVVLKIDACADLSQK